MLTKWRRLLGAIAVSCLFLALGACGVAAEEITVAAAADLNYALNELASRYQKATGNKVVLSFGSSGNLFSQIESGAPFDLFFSADEGYPAKLVSGGRAQSTSLRIYAIGHLVLWVRDNSGFDPQTSKMDLLLQPGVKRIAIANPEHAPYGRAAMAALESFGMKEKVAKKIVVGESISQAAQFVQSGNAQAGLIALSLASSPSLKEDGRYWELPAGSYPEIRQAAVIVSGARHTRAAHAFLDYVTSQEGAAVLQQYGFQPGRQP